MIDSGEFRKSAASSARLEGFATKLRRPGMQRSIARTAGFNVAAAAAAGLGGIILARTLGPTVRGEYAAITAWFGVVLVVGAIGQPAALCFYVAREPLRAHDHGSPMFPPSTWPT